MHLEFLFEFCHHIVIHTCNLCIISQYIMVSDFIGWYCSDTTSSVFLGNVRIYRLGTLWYHVESEYPLNPVLYPMKEVWIYFSFNSPCDLRLLQLLFFLGQKIMTSYCSIIGDSTIRKWSTNNFKFLQVEWRRLQKIMPDKLLCHSLPLNFLP